MSQQKGATNQKPTSTTPKLSVVQGGNPGASKGKGAEDAPENCTAASCKSKATRFSFCESHYDQYKFGLINKSGKPVPDYEKKIEHYEAYQKRSQISARKVA